MLRLICGWALLAVLAVCCCSGCDTSRTAPKGTLPALSEKPEVVPSPPEIPKAPDEAPKMQEKPADASFPRSRIDVTRSPHSLASFPFKLLR
jgi:hypothetical protein